MKTAQIVAALSQEAALFKHRAREHALTAIHKSPDGRTINEQDARLIRDHEIRAETFKAAATLAAS